MTKFIQCIQAVNETVTIKETIYAIKKAGFDGAFVQWYNKNWDFSQQEQLDLCRELGLEVPFVHLGYKGINCIWEDGLDGDLFTQNILKDLDKCKGNNIDLVVMHTSSKSIAPPPSKIGIIRLQKIVNYAEDLNIKIAFENNKIKGYLEYIFEHIKNSNIGLCYDVGHCHCHFNSDLNWQLFKGKVFAVHLHDNDQTDDLHLLPFDGTIDWKYHLQKLKEADYNGPITLESCYRYHYLNMTLENFYKESLKRAKELDKITN